MALLFEKYSVVILSEHFSWLFPRECAHFLSMHLLHNILYYSSTVLLRFYLKSPCIYACTLQTCMCFASIQTGKRVLSVCFCLPVLNIFLLLVCVLYVGVKCQRNIGLL